MDVYIVAYGCIKGYIWMYKLLHMDV